MLEHESPLDYSHRDARALEWFLEDKLVRTSSHCLLRALAATLEQLFDKTLDRSFLPPSVKLQARASAQDRLAQLADGTLCWVNPDTGAVAALFPVGFSLRDLLLCTHTIDRAPTNLCAMSFASHAGLLWTPCWGPFHDLWNGLKAAAKAQESGEWWLNIMRFAAVCNLNHGPFRSGAWGRAKQAALRTSTLTRSSHSAEFRAAATRQAQLLRKPVPQSDEDFEVAWRRFQTLPSCHEAGPVLKLARWLSINECWSYYREELWLRRLVLQDLALRMPGLWSLPTPQHHWMPSWPRG